MVDIGHGLRLHRALLLRCGLQPHIVKHNSGEVSNGHQRRNGKINQLHFVEGTDNKLPGEAK